MLLSVKSSAQSVDLVDPCTVPTPELPNLTEQPVQQLGFEKKSDSFGTTALFKAFAMFSCCDKTYVHSVDCLNISPFRLIELK